MQRATVEIATWETRLTCHKFCKYNQLNITATSRQHPNKTCLTPSSTGAERTIPSMNKYNPRASPGMYFSSRWSHASAVGLVTTRGESDGSAKGRAFTSAAVTMLRFKCSPHLGNAGFRQRTKRDHHTHTTWISK